MEKIATTLAVRISETKTIDELRALWVSISSQRKELGEWYMWLNDFKDSRKFILSQPDTDILTKEGHRWLKQK